MATNPRNNRVKKQKNTNKIQAQKKAVKKANKVEAGKKNIKKSTSVKYGSVRYFRTAEEAQKYAQKGTTKKEIGTIGNLFVVGNISKAYCNKVGPKK
jgi:hypothetical protein